MHQPGCDVERITADLMQCQKLQMIGQLTAGMIHEINNSLGYVSSNLFTLIRDFGEIVQGLCAAEEALDRAAVGEDPRRQRERFRALRDRIGLDALIEDFRTALDESRQGTERIAEIAKTLREFTHLDEGKRIPADLNALLETSVRTCWSQIHLKAKVQKNFGVLPPVVCSPNRLIQLFVNLLTNAAQAIEQRGEIFLTTRADEGEAIVRIRDTGRGMTRDVQEKLFQPFFTTKSTGVGLGLHLIDRIVRSHGGRIEVNSEPGKGTEFTLRLPLKGPG